MRDSALGPHAMKARFPSSSTRNGFSLVVTVSMLVILTVVAVGLLSLSSIAVKNTTITSAEQRAQANARMALMMAIAELQRHTGADTRITATADIINPAYPPVVGVWRSWEGTNHDSNGRPIAPNYGAKTQPESSGGRFVHWLVSSASGITSPTIGDVGSLIAQSPGTDTVPLLADGSLVSTDPRQVHVIPTKVENDGRIAWWISPENQKARLSQPHEPRTDDVVSLYEMGQSHAVPDPQAFGMASLLGVHEPFDPDGSSALPASRVFSRMSMSLVEDPNPVYPDRKFHDFTTSSMGLMTNSATGGWRKDLSILTERWDEIYAAYPGGLLPLFRITPEAGTGSTTEVPKPSSSNYKPDQCTLYPWSDYSVILGKEMPATLHAAAASWQSLQSFATAYKGFTATSGGVESPFVWDPIARTGNKQGNGTNFSGQDFYNFLHKQRLYPQIARFQFLIYMRAIPDSNNPARAVLWMNYVPVLTMWNPYNVRLTIETQGAPTDGLVAGFRRGLPGALAIVPQNGYPDPDTVPKDRFRLISNGNFQYLDVGGNWNGEYDVNLQENIDRYTTNPSATKTGQWVDMRTSGINLPTGQITFEPGEAVIFSPDGRIARKFGGTSYGTEIGYKPEAVEGWSFPVSGNVSVGQRYWFLLRTDKHTQPYRNRKPGVGFSLSYGIAEGNSYTAGTLYSGIGDEYHNITALVDGNLAATYWPQSEVDEIGYSVGELIGPWVPLFSMTMGPRISVGSGIGTEQNRPTKGVLQSDPLVSMVLPEPGSNDSKDHPANNTFDMAYHSLSLGSTITPGLSDREGYIATGHQMGDGLSRIIMTDLPLRPMASLVELQGWNPRGHNPYPPFQTNLIGNSDATPLIPKDRIAPPSLKPSGIERNLMHDDSYCANHLLFDDWFLSSIAPQPDYDLGGGASTPNDTVYSDFLRGSRKLSNRSYHPIPADKALSDDEISDLVDEIINSPDGWLKSASRLEIAGMFNVNSTSVEAWKALLGHARNRERIAAYGDGQIESMDTNSQHIVSRGAIATDVVAGSGPGHGGQFANASEYTGCRSLSDQQIEDLADNIVEQIRLRGPFLSLSEFVNRQLSNNTDLALAGAVQSAINQLSEDPMAVLRNPANALSEKTMAAHDPRLNGADYEFPDAAEGDSAYGAPAWIRQADILRPIAPILTVRDDTFTIRAYGDALDSNGNVLARAWCEAVVVRKRDFCDGNDSADSIDPPTSATNERFGRQYEVVSFRWLTSTEI